MNETDSYRESLVKFHAELFFLMNQYAGDPCICTAEKIARKIEQIRKHPLVEILPELQAQYANRVDVWRSLAGIDQKAAIQASNF